MPPQEDEAQEQQHAFQNLLQQIQSAPADQSSQLEAALMEQVEPLFLYLLESEELVQLSTLLAQLSKFALQKASHRHLLTFFHAVLSNEQAHYDEAEQAFLALLNEPDLEPHLRARSRNALGILYDYLSQYDKAINVYAQSAEEYLHLGDPIRSSKAKKNQGIVYHELRQFEKALPLFEECYTTAVQLGDPVLEMRALLELGYTAKELGQWTQAESTYHKALALAQQLQDHDMLARLHNNIGSVACFTGDWSSARTHYLSALDLARDNREQADVLYNLGFLHAIQGLTEQAQHYYERGLVLARSIVDNAAISEFYFRLGQMWRAQGKLLTAYRAYARSIAHIERMRGKVAQEETRISVLGIREHVYQEMVLLCCELGSPAKALSYIERAKSRAFLDMIGGNALEALLSFADPLNAPQIQRLLPQDAALVEYYTTGQNSPAETMLDCLPPATQHLRTYFAPPEQILACVVTQENIEVILLKAKIKQIEAKYFYRGDNRLRGTNPWAGDKLEPMKSWHLLDAQLLTPLRPLLRGKKHLFLLPHSTLHYLPFHALASSGHLMDDEQITISYAPSASILFKAGKQNVTATSTSNNYLTIGVNHRNLIYAEAEAFVIAQMFDKQGMAGQALTAREATVDSVTRELPQAALVHFACHAHFQQATPMNSALELFDGVLTAAKILQLPRLRAQLVVLSACDTGLNRLTHGDELMGLTRALLGNGAATLLVTLWQVPDIPTRLFMEAFYGNWKGNKTRATALQKAQEYLRTLTIDNLRKRLQLFALSPEKIEAQITIFSDMLPGIYPFDHPVYWGAFLLVGDPG